MFSRNGVLQGAPPTVFPKRFHQWGSRKVFPTTGISQEDSGKGLIGYSRKGFPQGLSHYSDFATEFPRDHSHKVVPARDIPQGGSLKVFPQWIPE
jgi:hypothetical protein